MMGWGFPLNDFESHLYVDQHALCKPVLMYTGPLDVWPVDPLLPRCVACEAVLYGLVSVHRDRGGVF